MRGFVQLDSSKRGHVGVEALIDGEVARGLDREDDGKRIAGYGAPAKATTLMHHFGIGTAEIEFIVDDNPLKQSLYSPGLHVPVLPSSSIAERGPDYLLILAWNFAEPIIEKKCADFAQNGGRFIVPLPDVRVI